LKNDRVMAQGLGLMAIARGTPLALSPQPLTMASVRDLMWQSVGLFRTREGLAAAVAALHEASAVAGAAPPTADGCRQRNLTTVATLIARAALRREESRGGHFREDFPERDDRRWKIHIVDASVE
jgi:L-aspartate oxidase